MFRKVPNAPGILFIPANAMQTMFMLFNLNIVFLTKDNKVVKILRNVRPWRHTWFYTGTSKVLEVPAGKLISDLEEGDVLEFV